MSRIIVKNLPKSVTEDKIKQIFGEHGTVTDIQLKYTPEGKFRQFGFVGYQKEEEAQKAVKYLNNIFINTSKITVETCATLGDSNKPKAWSKYAADSSAFKSKKGKDEASEHNTSEKDEKIKNQKSKSKAAELLEKYKDDPMFEEFLEAHGSVDPKKLLSKETEESVENKETEDVEIDNQDEESGEESEKEKVANKQISDLEYMQELMKKKPRQKTEKKPKEKIELFTLKLKGLPYSCKKKDIKDFFKPLTPKSIRVPRQVHGFAYVGFKTEKQFKKAMLKDKSFLAGKRIILVKYSGDSEENKTVTNPKAVKWKSQEEALKNEEDIAESGRIFVRNLAYTTTEDDIQKLFEKYGPLSEVNLPIDSTTRKPKGFGTVTFLMPEHAVKAYSELDGSILHGRMLHLLPAKAKDTPTDDSEETTNYKKQKAKKQKSQAGMSHNWNALFLGHDAVAEVIADSFGTTKEAVVGPDGKGSAAVRLALGETQIVAETRKYLEQEGVVLDTFSATTSKRSKTVILVKNLPSKTDISEIRQLFQKFGILGRVILPPSGITAIVEFVEPSEAKKAFTNLAYSKFKNVPLYLEWAPENSLSEKSLDTKNYTNQQLENAPENIQQSNGTTLAAENDDEDDDDEEPEPDTTIFVKNLNFKTTNEDLKKHFESCGKIHYATVATKKDKNDPNNTLSMGYGFVRFKHKEAANKALKTLQQSNLNGKSLELKRSERTLQNEVTTSRKTSKKTKQTGSKLLVRNVPFQANINELNELFKVFGEIKALRLPKKMSGDSHRGFAFVDYVTASDAKKAFEALSQSTHLYGRRLVLEWASTTEGVEDLRKRTADHFITTEETKKSKKGVFNIE